MFKDVEEKLKRKNKVLFNRDSKCLEDLIELIKRQKHRTLVLWAFECVKSPLKIFEEKYPDEKRPRKAIELCKMWASGEIKMPEAKRAILDCHAVCKEIDDEYYIALCHSIGQGISTVHVETHALGLPFYELTSIVIKNKNNYEEKVKDKINYYIDTLIYFQNNIDKIDRTWASFLSRDEIENKEKLLWEKKLNRK